MNWGKWNHFSVEAGLLGGVVGYLFGGWSVALGVLLTLACMDYLTGGLAGGIEGKLSSKVGFRGIAKKMAMFSLVAVGHLIDRILGEVSMVSSAVTYFYIANEILSIIENSSRIGLPIPKVLAQAVEIIKNKGDNKND